MNFAENILFCGDSQHRATVSPGKEDDKIACTEVREGSNLEPIRQISWKELRHRVGRCEQAMKAHGIKKGDRVAVVSSNSLDTLTVFLAVTALGGIFSSSSTDMGVKGILDRLTQIRPKLLFMDDKALYNGKKIDLRQKMADIVNGMKGIREFQGWFLWSDGNIPRLMRPLCPDAPPGANFYQLRLPRSSSLSNSTSPIHFLLYTHRERQANQNAFFTVLAESFSMAIRNVGCIETWITTHANYSIRQLVGSCTSVPFKPSSLDAA